MPPPEWIEVGRVARAHGVRGEVRVTLSTDNPDRFVVGAVMYAAPHRAGLMRSGPGRVPLQISSIRGMDDSPIVGFVGYETRTDAESLRGSVLQVPISELPELEEGEFYPFELEGLVAVDLAGAPLGTVAEVLETPAHDLLAVTLANGGELLVPFTHEIVPEVDLGAGRLVVDADRLRPAEGG
jgi:16S rRNA processing protein RimM